MHRCVNLPTKAIFVQLRKNNKTTKAVCRGLAEVKLCKRLPLFLSMEGLPSIIAYLIRVSIKTAILREDNCIIHATFFVNVIQVKAVRIFIYFFTIYNSSIKSTALVKRNVSFLFKRENEIYVSNIIK